MKKTVLMLLAGLFNHDREVIMKRFFLTIALMGFFGCANAASESLEYGMAVIDAGAYVPKTDTSVERAKSLLSAVSKVYRVNQQQAADMAAMGKNLANEKGLNATMAELLDWSLVACDVTCTKADLASFISLYIATRAETRKTHHQTVHGLLILKYIAKTTMGSFK
ncbi:MAG: hypothetical protein Q8O79_00925 [Pseudomonadota bacterium]|nr:hypothetical protein [Pseudomonadota bacterium]